MSSTVAITLDGLGRQILRELREESLTQGAIIDFTDSTRGKIQPRLRELLAADYIEYAHEPTSLYRITDIGKAELTNGNND